MKEKLYSAVTEMNSVIYRDFYKIYYKERLKTFNIISAVIGIALILLGVYFNNNGFGLVWSLIAVWIGAVLLVYPRMAYKKPYKRAKGQKQTTRFAFYEGCVAEKIHGETTEYKYADLLQIIETNKYFLIFHTMESISIVDKSNMSCNTETMSEFLKTKAKYKRIKA